MKLNNRSGFGALEFLIIAFIFVIIGGLAWYALAGKPKATKSSPSPTASNQVVVDEYAGWKTGSLKNEKVIFKYPSDWVLTDSSYSNEGGSMDKVTLVSPLGFEILLDTNVWGIGGSCADCKTYETTKEQILGKTVGVNIYGGDKGASGIGLAQNNVDGKETYDCAGICSIPGKNTKNPLSENKPGLILVRAGYKLSSTDTVPKSFSYDTFRADANVVQARMIFKSLSY